MSKSVEKRIRALSMSAGVTKVRSIKDIESFGKKYLEVRLYVNPDVFNKYTAKDEFGAHLLFISPASNLVTMDFEVPA